MTQETQAQAGPVYRWWLPHFDKLPADDRARLGRLADRITAKARELNGTDPANTVQVLEAALVILAEDRHVEIRVKVESP